MFRNLMVASLSALLLVGCNSPERERHSGSRDFQRILKVEPGTKFTKIHSFISYGLMDDFGYLKFDYEEKRHLEELLHQLGATKSKKEPPPYGIDEISTWWEPPRNLEEIWKTEFSEKGYLTFWIAEESKSVYVFYVRP